VESIRWRAYVCKRRGEFALLVRAGLFCCLKTKPGECQVSTAREFSDCAPGGTKPSLGRHREIIEASAFFRDVEGDCLGGLAGAGVLDVVHLSGGGGEGLARLNRLR